MSSKDLYKVLEVTPSASTHDIKKAYRKLAHKYHPDKNGGNKLSEVKFREIQDAYKILSDDKKRQDYNHKRFDRQHGFQKKPAQEPITAGMILQRTKDLRKKISQIDTGRMDKDALYNQIEKLFTPHHIALIQASKNPFVNRQVIENILAAAMPLNYELSVKVVQPLLLIAGADTEAHESINRFLKSQLSYSFWQKYQLLFAVVVAILFCILIYIMGE